MARKLGPLRRLPEIELLFPSTLSEALSMLRKHSLDARVIAGGTDLLPKMKRRELVPRYVIDLKGIADLNFVKYNKKDGLRIGATTTLSQILESSVVAKNCPMLVQTVSQMASIQIRNTATIGGNLCNAVPSADTAPSLIALGARLRIAGPKKREKTVLAEQFFKGPNITLLAPGDLLVEVQLPSRRPNESGTYLKHTLRREMDLAIVGVAVHMTLDSKKWTCKDVKIAMGAVAAIPMRAEKAEKALIGKGLHDGLIEDAANLASQEAKPIDDIRSSAEYRREMVKVLTRRAIKQCMQTP